jgi:acetyl-CoA carboxylase biotin carboxyl carrier protein
MPSAQAAMDALCHSVAEVLRVTPSAPTRLHVQVGGAMVVIEWSESGAVAATPTQPETVLVQPSHYVVSSPLVGAFYRAPESGADPFVEVGDVVAAGDQVAIIEAMKLMNPVHTNQAGRLVQTPVDNGESVEYGQPLLVFEPVAAEAES